MLERDSWNMLFMFTWMSLAFKSEIEGPFQSKGLDWDISLEDRILVHTEMAIAGARLLLDSMGSEVLLSVYLAF